MKCPFCANAENKVIDSRIARMATPSAAAGRPGLQQAFPLPEIVEEILPMVVKKDGRPRTIRPHENPRRDQSLQRVRTNETRGNPMSNGLSGISGQRNPLHRDR